VSTLAYYHPRGLPFNFADMPLDLYNEAATWRGRIKRGDAPVFTCLQTGEPMYVCRNDVGRYFMRHFPGSGHGGHAMSTMSDEHRRQAEYTRRAAAENSLDSQLEVSTGNGTRLDVAVYGDTNTGFEIQRSMLSRAKAKSRALQSFEAGWPTAWISDSETDPDWSDHVPTARLTVRGWDALPPPNTVHVVIGEYVADRDRSRPTGWRYRREPKAVLLDELAYLMPAGEIVPVAVGTEGRVDLAFKTAVEVIDSCTYPGAARWNPTDVTPRHKETAQYYTKACSHPGEPSNEPAAEPPLSKILAAGEAARQHIAWAHRPAGLVCRFCPQPLWHPDSIARGYCEACRIREVA
jgi:hypothetical protein